MVGARRYIHSAAVMASTCRNAPRSTPKVPQSPLRTHSITPSTADSPAPERPTEPNRHRGRSIAHPQPQLAPQPACTAAQPPPRAQGSVPSTADSPTLGRSTEPNHHRGSTGMPPQPRLAPQAPNPATAIHSEGTKMHPRPRTPRLNRSPAPTASLYRALLFPHFCTPDVSCLDQRPLRIPTIATR